MKLSLQSKYVLRSLTIRRDRNHFIVEESDSGEFFEMPEAAVDAISQINQGKALPEIGIYLKSKYPEEEVDMLAFMKQLFDFGLIKEIDGELVEGKKRSRTGGGFSWIPVSAGRLFFNGVTVKIYFALILINLLIFFIQPSLIPHYRDLFLFDVMVFNVLVYMGLSLVLIMIHEFGHILAIRSHDLPAKLSIGHRLLLVVFETDLTAAWKLEPKQRNKLFLGGIFFDQTIMFAALSILLVSPARGPVFSGILSIVILDIFIKAIYQCCFYMKTDLYYVCENVTGCYNLMENGKQLLKKWFPFIKTDPSAVIFDNEKRPVRLYSIFYVCGLVMTAGLFLFYFAPQAFFAYTNTLPALLHPAAGLPFWDAVIFLCQTIVMVSLLAYSWLKSQREKMQEDSQEIKTS